MNGRREFGKNPMEIFKNKLKQNLSKPKTLEEYFLIIGIDPQISSNKYLYSSTITFINENYAKSDFKPQILSKFPPINKTYLNIDDTIIDLCFPDGFNLLEFNQKPEPIFQHFILDNSFYSIEYPLKYVSCMKIYESLENYYLLNKEINKKLGDSRDNNFNNLENINNDYKNYYFPKILCFISTQNFFKEQEEILNQIYDYYLDKDIKRKIPIEKIILTTLFNIPLPPRGALEIEYKLNDKFNKIKLKRQKMNKLPVIKDELNLIFNKFDTMAFLEIFKHLIFETKILIFGKEINELSFFIYGLISLLFPFRYSFQISSSIPSNAYNVIESISPYILGINKKYKKSFFKENKIDIRDLNLLIIDLDKSTIKYYGNRIIPDYPKFFFRSLYDGLNNIIKTKPSMWTEEENENNYKILRIIFYNFFVNLMTDYDLYIKNDYFKNKLTNTGINNLYRVEDFVNSHSYNERNFYQNFSETQMFCDFIYRKMIAKDANEKLETLFFDESLIRKSNKKIFSKKKQCVFLNSKDYEYNKVYQVPQSKLLSKEEKKYFNNNYNENNNNNLIYLGQKIKIERNEKNNEIDYTYEYFLFPKLNQCFFEFLCPNEYYLAPEIALFSDIDKTNTDILSKSLINSNNNLLNNTLNNINEMEMKNYIYLVYLELWAYNYWCLDSFEKEEKFNELLEILSKITFHEDELFDNIFESLHKFKDKDKILKLYDFLLKYQISPSSYIYQTVNSYLVKSLKKSASACNYNCFKCKLSSKKNNKKSFRSVKDGNCLGDKIKFCNYQKCPECGSKIDLTEICLDFKNMKKDFFWAKCQNCEKYIIPKLGVVLGTEIISKEENEDIYNNYYSSIYTTFILHSPYELKLNLKKIRKKDGFKIFRAEYFKEEYPSLFWSCIWYFKLYKMNLDIILPYEWAISKEVFNYERQIPTNISSSVYINSSFYINKNKKSKKNKKNNYLNDNLVMHSIISSSITPNNEKEKTYSISNNYCRKSTNASSNKSTLYCSDILGRISMNSILSEQKDKNIFKFNSCTNLPPRVRLNTLTSSYLLSPTFKSRQLFDYRSSNSLISIKEKEESFEFPFNSTSEEDDDDENENNLENKNAKNLINEFDFNDINNKFYKNNLRNKSFDKIKQYKVIEYTHKKERNNSVIICKKKVDYEIYI